MEQETNFIRFKTIIEVLGKPKEHVEIAIKDYVQKIKDDQEFMVVKEYFSEPKEQDNMFSVFAELEMVVKTIPKLVGFCFDYMPSSIEILKPENLLLTNVELTHALNDLQAKLHNVDMVAKQLKNESDFLKRNLKTSLKNNVMIVLAIKKTSTIEELSKFSGIELKEIEKFLEELVKEGKIKKEGNIYTLA